MYRHIKESYNKQDFIGTRAVLEDGSLGEYEYESYTRIIEQAENLGSGLTYLKLCPEVNDFQDYYCRFIAVFSPNIPMWYKLDITTLLYGFTIVPLNNTLNPDSIAHVLNLSKIETLALHSMHEKKIVLLKAQGKLPYLKNIISMNNRTLKDSKKLFHVFTANQIIQEGSRHP